MRELSRIIRGEAQQTAKVKALITAGDTLAVVQQMNLREKGFSEEAIARWPTLYGWWAAVAALQAQPEGAKEKT